MRHRLVRLLLRWLRRLLRLLGLLVTLRLLLLLRAARWCGQPRETGNAYVPTVAVASRGYRLLQA